VFYTAFNLSLRFLIDFLDFAATLQTCRELRISYRVLLTFTSRDLLFCGLSCLGDAGNESDKSVTISLRRYSRDMRLLSADAFVEMLKTLYKAVLL